MKKLILLGILVLLNTVSYSQNLFTNVDLVDEFGDKIGTVKRNVAKGVFSNTATSNSELKVTSILTLHDSSELKNYLLDTAKVMQDLKKIGTFSDKEIKKLLPQILKDESVLKSALNNIGNIKFIFDEYNNGVIKDFIGENKASISINTSNGLKISSNISLITKELAIIGYKEITKDVQSMINYDYYDWNQTLIFNEIAKATDPIQVVIYVGKSSYNFTLSK